jgi:hypothetical protein
MAWDKTAWAADLIIEDAPRDFLETLIPLDGTTPHRPLSRVNRPKIPSAMHGFGLIEGMAGAGLGDPGYDYLTRLGQAVVDRLKRKAKGAL